MKNEHPYQTVSSQIVYQNPWIRVREDKIIRPSGDDGIYGVVESNDSNMIVVVNDKKEIYLIYTYSYPDQSWNWELPGGGNDGEDAVLASKRELLEETGIDAKDWALLGKTRVCNGLMTEFQYIYLAHNVIMTDAKKDVDDAAIVSHGKFYSLTEIHNMIASGEVNDNQSLTGLYLAEQWLSRQR